MRSNQTASRKAKCIRADVETEEKPLCNLTAVLPEWLRQVDLAAVPFPICTPKHLRGEEAESNNGSGTKWTPDLRKSTFTFLQHQSNRTDFHTWNLASFSPDNCQRKLTH